MPTIGVSHGPILASYSSPLSISSIQVGLYHLQTLFLRDPPIDDCKFHIVLLYIVERELETIVNPIGPLLQLEIRVFYTLR